MLVAALLSTLIGASLGLLGGGGSILTLPMLVYVLHVPAKDAIATSLFVVGVTSAVGVVAHARRGNVDVRVGALFGVAGMVGAYAGGRLAQHIPAPVLLGAFAVMMLATSLAMMRRRAAAASVTRAPSVGRVLALGALAGAVSGLVGAGGGFIVVPALALLGGLPMPRAIATSLLVIAMQSSAGFLGHAAHAHVDPTLLAVVATAAVAGSLVGVRLSRHVKPDTLRVAFGWLVLAMGVFLLAKQVPAAIVARLDLPSLVVGALLVAGVWIVRHVAAMPARAADAASPR